MPDNAQVVLVNAFGWADAVAWMLVIFGWIVAIMQSSRHDDRVDMRSSLDRITSQLIELEGKSIRYHASEFPEIIEAIEIKASIARLSSQIRHLGLLEYLEYSKVANLRKAITLRNFDTSKHEQQHPDSEIIQDIGLAVNAVLDCVEAKYQKKYTKRFWV